LLQASKTAKSPPVTFEDREESTRHDHRHQGWKEPFGRDLKDVSAVVGAEGEHMQGSEGRA